MAMSLVAGMRVYYLLALEDQAQKSTAHPQQSTADNL